MAQDCARTIDRVGWRSDRRQCRPDVAECCGKFLRDVSSLAVAVAVLCLCATAGELVAALQQVQRLLRIYNIRHMQMQRATSKYNTKQVQRLLREFFHGKEPSQGVNPDEAVAHGATVQVSRLHCASTAGWLGLAHAVSPL